MTIHAKFRDEKIQYDINREAAKISASSSGKIDKYEYLTDRKVLPSDQGQTIEQSNFGYSRLGKALQKQTEKQIGTLKSLNFSDKKGELKKNQGIFPQTLMNDSDSYKDKINF